MERTFDILDVKSNYKTYLVDFLLLSFIYFIPAISHMFAFPVYYLDPMRIALVFALIFTSKRNTFIIALTLPVFSFLISSHPQIIKAFLLSAELLINLTLFFLLNEKLRNTFASFLISVLISKIIYYLLKWVLISSGLLEDKLFSTPYYYQVISVIILSGILMVRFDLAKTKK